MPWVARGVRPTTLQYGRGHSAVYVHAVGVRAGQGAILDQEARLVDAHPFARCGQVGPPFTRNLAQ